MPKAPIDLPAVVIGAGHAGLAMSRRLSEHSIEHVVLERGEVANSWRTERWDSLRLLTPNWQSNLPGMAYSGDDPDGYMTMSEVTELITSYAAAIAAPVQAGTTVSRVAAAKDGYLVETDHGSWTCRCVVLASGGSNIADVPDMAHDVPPSIAMVTPMSYRHPGDLDDRGVLVVGASATGVQLADEIRRSGRRVVISVGEHVRMPRIYRGRDVFWWLDAVGISAESIDEVDDLVRARNLPSPQLIGTTDRRSIDLNVLTRSGVEVVGRLGRIHGGTAQFSGSLANVCMLADLKMNRMLETFDEWSEGRDLGDIDPPERFEATEVPSSPATEIGLLEDDFGSIVWATGYRPDYSWLDVPVLDGKGRIQHIGGVVDRSPGLYVTGLSMLRRRASSFIHGSNLDSEDLGNHLAAYLERTRAANRSGGRPPARESSVLS
jgi:putative flavoprotein involved in K+ transport